MNNNAMTVKLWDEITEVQSETLNGGSGGYNPISINIGGGVGSVQVNGGDGSQFNILPTGKGPNRGYGFYRGYRHH